MKYSRVLLLCILVLGLSSCETDDTEYWLSGIWAGQVGARDASFIFNENRTGSYRIEGDFFLGISKSDPFFPFRFIWLFQPFIFIFV